jgi:hypothetical protein
MNTKTSGPIISYGFTHGHRIGLYQCIGKSKIKWDITPINDETTNQGVILHTSFNSVLSTVKIVEIIGA